MAGSKSRFPNLIYFQLDWYSTLMSSALRIKPPQNYPSRLALDIIKSIIAKKGPIETKQLWALSQKVQPTPEELEQDTLEKERTSEISQLATPEYVYPEKPPEKEKAPPGLSNSAAKRHRKMQAGLAKLKKMDNGHPVKSTSCVRTIAHSPWSSHGTNNFYH